MIANPRKPVPIAFNDTSFIHFIEAFKTEKDCMRYLYNLKFSLGFTCSKCNNTTSYRGLKPYTQVCRNCQYTESATSNTLFHKVKFSLVKAFMILYDMNATTKGMSARAISVKYDSNKDTAWLFMKKVRQAMESSTSYPMTGKVYVDEYVIGGYEKGAVGRKNKSNKVKLIMAVEVTDKNKIKRMYSMKLDDYSTEEVRKIFDKHISKDAIVYTDGWRSYNPLKKEWNIIQNPKLKKNSPVNTMIQQQKSWLRGVYHSVSEYHCIDYLNEFSFRINRSQWRESIFHKCVDRMVKKDKKSKVELSRVGCMTRNEFVSRIFMYERMGVHYQLREGKIRMVA